MENKDGSYDMHYQIAMESNNKPSLYIVEARFTKLELERILYLLNIEEEKIVDYHTAWEVSKSLICTWFDKNKNCFSIESTDDKLKFAFTFGDINAIKDLKGRLEEVLN
jgi:hypothetical protein